MITMGRKSIRYARQVEQGLGKRIRQLRNERGWTLEKLAEATDTHGNYLGLIELGRRTPSIATLIKLAEAFGIPVYQLFFFDSDIAPKQQAIQELVDLLKVGGKEEPGFLISIVKEHRKRYGS